MDADVDDRDSPWKEALDRCLEDFLRLLFPVAHAAIDWARGWEPLDAELQQVVRDAEIGRRLADKLFRVWLTNGDEAWVLIHVEVQGQVDDTLPERAFVYHYRIFDKYERPVATLIVLADDRPEWRPGPFRQELLGCRVGLEYPSVKLLDWSDRLAELEADRNPFAVVVLAHLASLRTRKDPTARLHWKWRLTRALYDRGYDRQEILELFRVIDWLLRLPDELAEEFNTRMTRFEEERRVVYITQGEEMALKKGRQEAVQGLQKALLTVLEVRFGPLPEDLAAKIRQVTDTAALDALVQRAALVTSPGELFA
jgi:hypothetical protein